mmetsp:Transcript_138494/g.336606  ORF Transcript_138494/g.336606 Transcript_138494/m.336606 type:complete len:484 (+) Transcript_138494:38-1489(+)
MERATQPRAMKGADDLPEGWECHWSRSCSCYYYFNRVTGESRWYRPYVLRRRLRCKTEAAAQYYAGRPRGESRWHQPVPQFKRRRLAGKTEAAALDVRCIEELWAAAGRGPAKATLLRTATWRRFQEACMVCASSYPGSGIEIVFHQTREENLDSIAERGLLTGDGVTVPIAHGQKLGNGIYASLSVGPGHKQYGPVTVLCLGLQGFRPQSDTDGAHRWHVCSDPFSSTCWHNLIVAYRNGAQLLPLATVTSENLQGVCEAAKRVVAWLETRWPRLQRARMPVAVVAPSARERPSMAEKIGAALEKASQEPVSAAFAQVLEALQPFKDAMGGAPNLPEGAVSIDGKLPRARLETLTAFEHAAISVLGFARLQQLRYLITLLDDGTHYQQNLGTQALERYCSFTMHADRQDASVMLAQGPELLLAAFEAARREGRVARFFAEAFDRHSDPCLEGRVSLFQEFLQACPLAGPSEEHSVLCQSPGS